MFTFYWGIVENVGDIESNIDDIKYNMVILLFKDQFTKREKEENF